MSSRRNAREDENGEDNRGFTNDSGQARNRSGSVHDAKATSSTARTEPTATDNEDADKVDLSCGIWKLRTNIFGSKFSNLYVFSICIGLSSFFTMMVQSVIHVQLTSIERQFKIDNAKAGLFDTAARIGSMCTILFAGHFAKKVHIPLVVGLSGVIQGTVLMAPAIIQFLDPYTLPVLQQHNNTNSTDYGENGKYLCLASGSDNSSSATNTTEETSHVAFVVILGVQAVKGITDAFHSGFLPALYVDDNMIDKTRMGIFFGINSIISELAQPVGKQINGVLSNVPIDLKDTEMDPKDRRFVAAWWLAFLIFGAGTALFSIPVMLFPRKLVSKRQQEEALKKAMVSFTTGVMTEEPPTEETRSSQPERKESVDPRGINQSRPTSQYKKHSLAPRTSSQSGVLDALSYVRRASLLPPVDGPAERRISIDGTFAFEQPVKQKEPTETGESIQGSSRLIDLIKDFPKAFVRIFKRPVFILIIIDIIIISIPMSGTAIFRSVYITNEYNVSMSEVATLTGVTQAVGQIIGTLISGWLASRVKTKTGYNYIIVGTYLASMCVTPLYIIFGCDNQPVYGHEGDFGISINTTDLCGCRGIKQLISCGNDSNNYLSPCYAGCHEVVGKTFTNCIGLGDPNNYTSVDLTPGVCPTDCHANFLIYVIFHAVQSVLMSMGTIPRRLLILRMVDPKDRGFATSVFGFCSTLMSIPSPSLFGRVIDNTCLIWDGNYCSLYDRDKIRYLLSGLDIGVNVCVMITMSFIIYFFRKEEIELKQKLQNKDSEDGKTAELNIQ